MENALQKRIATTAFAFRGYNITNLGKTPELLAHPVYGPTVERHLRQASQIVADVLKQPVDLVQRVRSREETTLETYGEAIALIVAAELAQLALLEEFFDVPYAKAQLAVGYSLGEVTALVAGGVYDVAALLTPLLAHAQDAVDLAQDVSMGVLFSRGSALSLATIERRCLEITSEGLGTIAISSFLAPNTVLLLGQGRTIDHFNETMHEFLPKSVHLRKNPHRWPPMHTSLTRQRGIPDKASVMLETVKGGFTAPIPPILSCVTGDVSYDETNSREILNRWIDHPQQLWDVIDKLLAQGVETIIHVGPEPNILPATFKRLVIDITSQLTARSLAGLGLRAISRIVRRPRAWLTRLISSDATLLRAPFVEQIILEDWLLEQQPA